MDDVISAKNDFFMHTYMTYLCPIELELEETTESSSTVSYLGLLANIDGNLIFTLCGKKDEINFLIDNFPHLDIIIPVTPAHGVHVSQLIKYL